MKVAMLTTTDNPFDPFDQFNDWKAFDELMEHNTCNVLASEALTSPDLSPEDQRIAVEQAIDKICRINVLGIYRKVEREFPEQEPA